MARAGEHSDRSFGLVLGWALLALAAVRFVWAGALSWWLLGSALALFAAALTVPWVLGPLRTAWMKLAAVLGLINARILLTIVFAALVTPIAVVLRAFGRTPIRLTVDGQPGSYWRSRRPEEFTAGRMERQF
jgi:hypothetical protein